MIIYNDHTINDGNKIKILKIKIKEPTLFSFKRSL